MSAIPSAEVVIERLRMALDEAGYPDVVLVIGPEVHPCCQWPEVVIRTAVVPTPVWWMACYVVYPLSPCWACYSAGKGRACGEGTCVHPNGPARPPRELLAAS